MLHAAIVDQLIPRLGCSRAPRPGFVLAESPRRTANQPFLAATFFFVAFLARARFVVAGLRVTIAAFFLVAFLAAVDPRLAAAVFLMTFFLVTFLARAALMGRGRRRLGSSFLPGGLLGAGDLAGSGAGPLLDCLP